MSQTEQFNIRIPEGDREVLLLAARFLREEENGGERLRRFLKCGDAELNARLAQLEAKLESLEAKAKPSQTAAMPASFHTSGRGLSRRMTPAGKGMVIAMHHAGKDYYAIAAEVGVSWQAVRGFLIRNGVAA